MQGVIVNLSKFNNISFPNEEQTDKRAFSQFGQDQINFLPVIVFILNQVLLQSVFLYQKRYTQHIAI